MALYKIVDGVRIEMTPEEEGRTLAEWAANSSRVDPDPFDQEITPLVQAIVQELAAATRRTEIEVMASLKTKWETITNNK